MQANQLYKGEMIKMNTRSGHKIISEQKPAVLIIDDTPANLALLFDYLEEEEFTVLVAQSGAHALLQLQRFKPDIILLDVMMPGMDGFETCELLKANPETCEIPVIFLTALSDMVDKLRGFELGGVDYITKPADSVEVLARLRTHLAIRDLQNRLRKQLDFALEEVRERNALLSRTNQELTRLNNSYQAEMAQRQRHQQEKNRLLSLITAQTFQWRSLSTLLVAEADTAGKGLGRALNEQALQNLGLVLHSLDFISQSLQKGQPIEDSHLSHFHQTLEMLESTKSYLDRTSQVADKPRVSVDALSALTPREREVFDLLVDDKSTSEIARLLLLSEGSVHTYRNRIMKKLDIHSIIGLVKFAIKHGLIELD